MIDWDGIQAEYEAGGISLGNLAEKHNIPLGTLKSRKRRDKWKTPKKKTKASASKKPKKADASKPKKDKKTDASKKTKKETETKIVFDSEHLTGKQEQFVFHYVKSFNATQSALKAGYSKKSAHVEGHRLLKNDKIQAAIKKIKNDMVNDVYVDALDVLQIYIKIAFADITDFVDFERVDIHNGGYETILNEDRSVKEFRPKMDSYNQMFFKSADEVDGSLISEVRQGKDGVVVKLIDKKFALDKLDQYFDMLPDHHKRKMEEERLKLDQMRFKKEDSDKPIRLNIIRKQRGDDN